MEICNVEMKGMPLRHDQRNLEDKVSFLNRVAIENPELFDYAEQQANEPPQDIDDDEEDEGNEE
jgi:hypothetical protein